MSEISAYELAHRMVIAKPDPSLAVSAKAAFVAIKEGNEEISEDSVAQSLMPVMKIAYEAKPEGMQNSSLIFSSAFAASAVQEGGLSPDDNLMARHIVALAAHRGEDGNAIDLKQAINEGGIPSDVIPEIRDSVFNASHVSDSSLKAISGKDLFSVPSEKDESFATEVLSSDRASLAGNPLAFRASMAVEALDIDSEGEDAPRLLSSLARISADRDAPSLSTADMSVRIASDVAAQSRAQRLSSDGAMEETDERFLAISEAALSNPKIAEDLQKEAQGKFHEMSRGSMLEIRSDMESGANLPADMVRFIRLSAEKVENRSMNIEAREEVAEKKAEARGPMPSTGMEI